MKKLKDFSAWVAAAFVFALGFTVFYALAQREGSDISIHAIWAGQGSFANLKTFVYHGAHPLWHFLVALTVRTGVPLLTAAALVTALCKAAEVLLLCALAARFVGGPGLTATLCGLAASLVSAVWIPAINPQVYYGVGSPNTWHSPTQMIAMVFMLLCVPMTARLVEGLERRLPQDGPRTNVAWREAMPLAALQKCLAQLAAVERDKLPSIDRAADPFARLLAGCVPVEDGMDARVLRELFYHIGRWIYLIDACYDVADDWKSGSYNPVILRYELQEPTLTPVRDALETTLSRSLAAVHAAFALLDVRRDRELIENIICLGLPLVTRQILDGTYQPNGGQSRHGSL